MAKLVLDSTLAYSLKLVINLEDHLYDLLEYSSKKI